MNQDQLTNLAKLRAPFPPEGISKLPKRFKDKHGNWQSIDLDYVGHAHITERLLDCDPLWSWAPLATVSDKDQRPVFETDRQGNRVGLWITLTICGRTMLGYGSCEAGKSDAEKELIGDALRNAAMRLGAGLDLWKKDGPNREKIARESAFEPQATARPAPTPQRASTRPAPDAKPAPAAKPVPAEEPVEGNYADAVQSMFGSSEPANDRFDGVPITIPVDIPSAMESKFAYGKHKGKTIREMTATEDGRGYLRWMVNAIKADFHNQGKQPSEHNQCILLVVDHLDNEGGAQ